MKMPGTPAAHLAAPILMHPSPRLLEQLRRTPAGSNKQLRPIVIIFQRGMKARAPEALDAGLTKAIGKISNRNASGWFRHCGYSLH